MAEYVRGRRVCANDATTAGHRFDPLAERETEDDLYRAAQDIPPPGEFGAHVHETRCGAKAE
jgi:hypothetical protein